MSEAETIVAGTGRLDVGTAAEGQLRWIASDVASVIEEARGRLDLAPLPTVALGRCMAAAAMLSRLSGKSPLRLTLDLRGDGPLRRVFSEIDHGGDVRGLVNNGHLTGTEGPQDLRVGPALGRGLLTVRREPASGRAHESQVELVTGEIGADVAHFLAQSEQRRSAVLVGVFLRPNGVAAAGGLLVEAMPAAATSVISEVEDRIAGVDSVSRLLGEVGLDGVVERVLGSQRATAIESHGIRYRCRCERARLVAQLSGLSREEVAELSGPNGTLAAECAYCGQVYHLTADELEAYELTN